MGRGSAGGNQGRREGLGGEDKAAGGVSEIRKERPKSIDELRGNAEYRIANFEQERKLWSGSGDERESGWVR